MAPVKPIGTEDVPGTTNPNPAPPSTPQAPQPTNPGPNQTPPAAPTSKPS